VFGILEDRDNARGWGFLSARPISSGVLTIYVAT
jgi:hypothetical protein